MFVCISSILKLPNSMADMCCLLLLCQTCGRRQTLRTPMEKFTRISALIHKHTVIHLHKHIYKTKQNTAKCMHIMLLIGLCGRTGILRKSRRKLLRKSANSFLYYLFHYIFECATVSAWFIVFTQQPMILCFIFFINKTQHK